MKVEPSKNVLALVAVLRRVCAALPGAEEYVMVHHPAFRVGKKPFVIAGMEERTKGATLSINLGREAQPQLLDDARFTRTPYIGQHGWVTVVHEMLRKGELEVLVTDSYRRVAGTKQRALLDTTKRPTKKNARALRVHEAKTELSKLLEAVEAGERIVIARAGEPVAILSAYKTARRRRVLGQFRGQGRLADDFDLLPEDLTRAFEGDST